jgi:hypothetical protein
MASVRYPHADMYLRFSVAFRGYEARRTLTRLGRLLGIARLGLLHTLCGIPSDA